MRWQLFWRNAKEGIMVTENTSPTPPRLSLSMIVRDEEKFLEGCLGSVRGIVDEIVLVDTGSTDATIAIAQRHGAKVVQQSWRDDFAEARNTSLSYCTGEWVLYLDADERLLPGQENALLALLDNRSAAAYNVIVRNTVSLPTGTSIQRMPYPRLFRRLPGVRFEGRVHEQIAPAIEASGGKIFPCSIVIDHLGYNQGFEILKQKAERNMQLLAGSGTNRQEDAYAWYQMGNTYLMLQHYPEAKEHLNRALTSPALPRSLRAQVLNLLAEAEIRTGSFARAEEYCRESLCLARHQITARWYLVGASIMQKKYATAVQTIKEMLSGAFPDAARGFIDVALDIQVEEATALQVLGQCHLQLSDPGAAVKALSRACDLKPDLPGVKENLLEAQVQCADRTQTHVEELIEKGDYWGAGRLIDEAEALGTRSIALERLGIDIALRERDLQKARHHLERMADFIPEDSPKAKQQLLALVANLSGAEAPCDSSRQGA